MHFGLSSAKTLAVDLTAAKGIREQSPGDERFDNKSVLNRAVLIAATLLFSVVGSQASFAACTVGTKTLVVTTTTTSPTPTYPTNGGAPAINLTYTLTYTTITSTSQGAGYCATSQTVDIVPSVQQNEGSFSNSTCDDLVLSIPNNIAAPNNNRTLTCTADWTAPSSPDASYSFSATASAQTNNAFNINSGATPVTVNRMQPPAAVDYTCEITDWSLEISSTADEFQYEGGDELPVKLVASYKYQTKGDGPDGTPCEATASADQISFDVSPNGGTVGSCSLNFTGMTQSSSVQTATAFCDTTWTSPTNNIQSSYSISAESRLPGQTGNQRTETDTPVEFSRAAEIAKSFEVYATPSDGTYTDADDSLEFKYYIKSTAGIATPTAATVTFLDQLFNPAALISCSVPQGTTSSTPAILCDTKTVTLAQNDYNPNSKIETSIKTTGQGTGITGLTGWSFSLLNDGKYSYQETTGDVGLQVDVAVSPAIYDPGQILTFTYTITNTGIVITKTGAYLTDNTPGMTFTGTCDIGDMVGGAVRTCTATFDTNTNNPPLAVDSDAKAMGLKGNWNQKVVYNNATALSRQLAEGWTFDLSADVPIYEEGKQVTFTGVVTNISIDNPKLKLKDVLLVINGGPPISPTSCNTPNNNQLGPGESVTCTWVHDVTQEDLDAGKIVAAGTVRADWKNYKNLMLSDSETLLSEGSAADIVQNTVGSFIKRRMDMMLSDEPAGYKIRNRAGAGAGVPVAFTGTSMNGTTNMAFATSSRALSAAADSRSARPDATGKGSLPSDSVMPTADAVIIPENDYNWWVEGKYTAYDSGDESDDTDRSGSFGIIHAGIDRKISDKTIIGVMLSLDWAQESADSLASVYAGESDVSGFGWMVGPYVSTALTENVFLDVRAAYGMSDNDIDIDIMDMPFSGGFQTTRWLVQAAISGQYQWGKFTFVPEATVSYMNEQQKSFDVSSGDIDLDVGSQSYSLGRLRVGPEISVRQEWEKGSFTPYLKPSLIWDFASEGQVIVSGDANLDGEVDDMGDLRAAIEGGLRTESDSGVTSSMSVTYDGIGVDLSAITFTGNVSIPF